MSQAGLNNVAGGGGGGITAIDGDTGGSATGPTVTFNGGFATSSLNGTTFGVSGNTVMLDVPFLTLPSTNGATAGRINFDNGISVIPYFHNYLPSDFQGQNIFVGGNAGNFTLLAAAAGNSAVGQESLNGLTTGSENSAFGAFALQSCDSGSENTAIGLFALGNMISGSNNIAIGPNAGSGLSGAESNNIYLGSQGLLGDSAAMYLGDFNTQTTCFIGGVAGVTTTNTQVVTINTSTGQLGSTASISPIVVVRQVFAADGTYVPTANMQYCDIEVIGGGAGSGGVATTGANTLSVSGGGGGGGYAKAVFAAAFIGPSQAVTVGVGGTAGAAGATTGGSGGTTSVGALISASGGSGSTGASATAFPTSTGGSGGVGSSGDVITVGGNGGYAQGVFVTGVLTTINTGYGGSCVYSGSQGGDATISGQIAAAPGPSVGAGASGAANGPNQTQQTGSNGGSGFVIITEYI